MATSFPERVGKSRQELLAAERWVSAHLPGIGQSVAGYPRLRRSSNLIALSLGMIRITEYGGAFGLGTVFKITSAGTLTTLYNFCQVVNQFGYCTDGQRPEGGLVQASNGNFYGTASVGGANDYGTAFKITPSGTLTTLYNFCSQSGCTDGASPVAGLIQATNGSLYGSTDGGGANTGGTVFEITRAAR